MDDRRDDSHFAAAHDEDSPQDRWRSLIPADEIAEGEAREFVVGDWIIALFRDANAFHALDGLCAHQGGPIAGGTLSKTDAGLTCVTCPWHGWQYELKTGIQTVNRQPLQATFPTRVHDGMVQIQVPE
ncbi:MAG: Rieske (2Fe-2S) protein [Planctomycetota bacterium]